MINQEGIALNNALGGRYTIDREIGAGGMGTVYLARDLRHERHVAIKVLRAEFARSLGADRFLREIRVAANLEHPHIVALYDSGDAGGHLYYVMPFIQGESLRDRLQREGSMPVSEALRITTQVADALHHAHMQGVVHRDIKPENILLSGGHAKVTDFGIALSAAADGDAQIRLTQTGIAVGTPDYMSPEQFLGEAVDGRSDVYSLACVLYELLIGERPFHGTNAQATMMRRLTEDAPRISTRMPATPPMVDMVVARALARDREHRQATMREFAAALSAEISAGTAIVPDLGAGASRNAGLVGRERELADARAMLANLAQGHGGVLLIGGEPGVGKTRLSQGIMDEARSRGALCLVGHCSELEGAAPYTPFAELLDFASRVLPRDTFRATLGDAAPDIARVQPALRQLFADIPDPIELPPDQQQRRFHASYREFNERAARVAPIVVLLDDLHWADSASLALLEHSASYLEHTPILFIGTYRDTDLEVNRPFARVMESLVRQRRAKRIPLKRLVHAQTAELLAALAGSAPPEALVVRVHSGTDGNPFFIEELFQHLREEGRLFDDHGGWRTDVESVELDVPEGVRLVIGRRLERLAEAHRSALVTASVIGLRFSVAVLRVAEGCSEDDLLDALDAATQARIITEHRGGRDTTYAFEHELIRQTLITSMSMPRRQRRHLKVADAMEACYGDRAMKHAADIGHHLFQAGLGADPERTASYLLAAADDAIGATAFQDALVQCERAGGLDTLGHVSTARASLLMAESLKGLGRLPEAEPWQRAALKSAYESADRALITRCAMALSSTLVWMLRWEDSTQVILETLPHIPATPSPERALLLAAAGGGYTTAYLDDAKGTACFDEAESIARQIGDPEVLAMVRAPRATSASSMGRTAECIRLSDEILPHLRGPRHRQLYCEVIGNRHFALSYACRFTEIAAERADLRQLAADSSSFVLGFFCHSANDNSDAVVRGSLADLERSVEELTRAYGMFGTVANLMQMNRAWAWQMQGRTRDAYDLVARNRRLVARNSWDGCLHGTELWLASMLDADTFNASLADCASVMPSKTSTPSMGQRQFAMFATDAFLRMGHREGAASFAWVHQMSIDDGMFSAGQRMPEAHLALSLMAGGDDARAAHHFESAIRLARRADLQWSLVDGLRWYGEMLSRHDDARDRAYAARLLDEGIGMCREHGLAVSQREAERLRATLGDVAS